MINSFVFYRSYLEAMETLSEQEQLKLFKAIAYRSLGEGDVTLSGTTLGMFSLIIPQIEANRKKYQNGAKGADFGKLGGRKSKQMTQPNDEPGGDYSPTGSPSGNPLGVSSNNPLGVSNDNPLGVSVDNPTETPNVNENDNDNVNGNENNNTADAEAFDADTGVPLKADESKKNSPKIDCGAVMEEYNRVCKSLPAVKCLTDARRTAIKARTAEHTAEKLHEVFEKAEKSDFLCGRNHPGLRATPPQRGIRENTLAYGNWRASFDWLLNKANFVKVLEGNYDNKPRGGDKPGFDSDQTDLSDIFPG